MASNTRFFLLFALPLLAGCAFDNQGTTDSSSAQQSIIGGSAAAEHAYPFIARLTGERFDCAGTLIAPRWVLTGSACLDGGRDLASLIVTIGGLSRAGWDGEIFEAESMYFAPAIDGLRSIALVRLKGVSSAVPTRLVAPEEAATIPVGTMLTAAGWGADRGLKLPDTLQQVALPLSSDADCKSYFGWDQKILCTEGYRFDRDVCSASDVGDPLFAWIDGTRVQVGVSIWPACAWDSHRSGFAAIAEYRDWIQQTMHDIDFWSIDFVKARTPHIPVFDFE